MQVIHFENNDISTEKEGEKQEAKCWLRKLIDKVASVVGIIFWRTYFFISFKWMFIRASMYLKEDRVSQFLEYDSPRISEIESVANDVFDW